MRGKKAKMLKRSTEQLMEGAGSERQKYRKLKDVYNIFALQRSQKPKPKE